MVSGAKESSRKREILACAAELFAMKGFTETSVRELAAAVGMKGASLYNHFPSKNAILTHMLEDYSAYYAGVINNEKISHTLRENPTTDGILVCLHLSFPPDRTEYYLKVLCVLLQEQHRNPVVRSYVSEQFILRAELNTKAIIDVLKELGVIRQDTDPDYWMKATSSLLYFFASRFIIGIGDNESDFRGMGMVEMLRYTFDMMFERCGVAKNWSKRPEENGE